MHSMKRTLALLVGVGCMLLANDEVPPKIQATKTEHADLPAGGTVRLKNSTGAVARQGDELVITTDFPRRRRYLPRPSVGSRDFDLEYVIKVPRDAKLIVDHDEGEIHFDDVASGIHATTNQGTITVRLSQSVQYKIDAKCRTGAVTSDSGNDETKTLRP